MTVALCCAQCMLSVPGGTLARTQDLCQSYVSTKILMHMTHVICCLSRKRSQWGFFKFISKGYLQLVNFIFLSESTIVDGISETSWQELILVSKWKIALEEGII